MEPHDTSLPPQTQTPHNEVHTGRSRDPLKMSAIALIVLLLAFGGVAAWQMVQLNAQNSKVSDLEKNVSDLQAAKTTLQTELDSLKGVDTSGSESDPDTLKILAAVDAYVRAPNDRTTLYSGFNYDIAERTDQFARVIVSAESANNEPLTGDNKILFGTVLKKVDHNWTVVLEFQDGLTDEALDKYSVPKDLMQ